MREFFIKMLKILPDSMYVRLLYYKHFHKWLNLNNPVSYNEKLQWLKLYDHNDLYTTLVDKLAMKEWLASKIGDGYTFPTLGVWKHAEDIDFDELPNQFVLKWNHDGQSIVICKDKTTFDKEKAISSLSAHEKLCGYWYGREWPYKNVPPLVFAETYMEDEATKELRDYKLFTFNGKAKLLLIASDRQKKGEDTKFDFYDMEMNHLDMVNVHPNASVPPALPSSFPKMIEIAEKLSEGMPHLRVDFYEVNGRPYIGELTFYHGSGFMKFSAEKWYNVMGEWLVLPQKTIN